MKAGTGALTAIGTGKVAAGTSPRSVTVDPSGRFAYVENSGDSTVSLYAINSTTGALTRGGRLAAGLNPTGLAMTGGNAAVQRTPKLASAANKASGNVSMYTIDAAPEGLTSSAVPVTARTRAIFP